MKETCSLCGLSQPRGRMWPSWQGGRWLCADVAACCDRFIAAAGPFVQPPPRDSMELGA